MQYVLDCSVAVKWFVPEPLSDVARRLLAQHHKGDVSFITPDVILGEFGHALRKLVLKGELKAEHAHGLVADFVEIGLPTVPLAPLAASAMQLSLGHTATFYDALYMALAIRDDLQVLTADNRMASAFARLDRVVRLADLTTT